ncbi:unnamed protein product, partial [Amoebophrya sp. A120]
LCAFAVKVEDLHLCLYSWRRRTKRANYVHRSSWCHSWPAMTKLTRKLCSFIGVVAIALAF